MSANPKRWGGSRPVRCDACGRGPTAWFVDGRVKNREIFGLFCEHCWEREGAGRLGIGHGQKYDATTYALIDGDYRTAEDEAFALQMLQVIDASKKNDPN
jgi:hypothetical protein